MKKAINIFIIYVILFTSTSYSQTYIQYGDRSYGSSFPTGPNSMIKLDSSHLILASSTKSNVFYDKTAPKCDSTTQDPDYWILKIDTAFNIIWDKDIGGNRSDAYPFMFYNTYNSTIYISGESISDISCQKTDSSRGGGDYWVSVLDTSGNELNDFTWGGTGTDHFPKIIRLQSGNYIIFGTSISPISGDKTVPNYSANKYDYWVIKTDSVGNKLWDKIYGGTGSEHWDSGLPSHGCDILSDGWDDFIIAGTTDSPISGNISDSSRGGIDIWVIKVDSAGNKIWDKRYGGNLNENESHIIHTNDNGYILCGTTDSQQGGDVSDSSKGVLDGDVWIVKLDSLGNKQWDKRYGGIRDEWGGWIEQAPGGGYWVSGDTRSDSSFDVTEHNYAGVNSDDYWIFKIDSVGNKIWDKQFGCASGSIGSAFVIMPDSSIFLYGQSGPGTSAVKTDAGHPGLDFWIVHFKYTDSTSTVGIEELANFNNSVSLFPNPTKDIITINSSNEKIKQIELFNIVGENIYTQKINNVNSTQINLQSYAQGFYLVKITGEKYAVTKKVLKE